MDLNRDLMERLGRERAIARDRADHDFTEIWIYEIPWGAPLIFDVTYIAPSGNVWATHEQLDAMRKIGVTPPEGYNIERWEWSSCSYAGGRVYPNNPGAGWLPYFR